MRNVLVAMSGLALLAACNGPAEESGAEEVEAASPPAEMAEGAAGQTGDVTLQASESFQSDLQTALIQASEGATITLPAGTFEMTDGLSLDVNGVTLTGAGEGETILDFSSQRGSGEGLHLRARHPRDGVCCAGAVPGGGGCGG